MHFCVRRLLAELAIVEVLDQFKWLFKRNGCDCFVLPAILCVCCVYRFHWPGGPQVEFAVRKKLFHFFFFFFSLSYVSGGVSVYDVRCVRTTHAISTSCRQYLRFGLYALVSHCLAVFARRPFSLLSLRQFWKNENEKKKSSKALSNG